MKFVLNHKLSKKITSLMIQAYQALYINKLANKTLLNVEIHLQ